VEHSRVIGVLIQIVAESLKRRRQHETQLSGMVALLGFVSLLAIIAEHLWDNLVAGNVSGKEHDDQR